jgi:hypothetical protein
LKLGTTVYFARLLQEFTVQVRLLSNVIQFLLHVPFQFILTFFYLQFESAIRIYIL